MREHKTERHKRESQEQRYADVHQVQLTYNINLQGMRGRATERHHQEAQHERQERLQSAAKNSQQRRKDQEAQNTSTQQYLREKGWADTNISNSR